MMQLIGFNTIQLALYCPVNGEFVYSVRIKKYKNNHDKNKASEFSANKSNSNHGRPAKISHGIDTSVHIRLRRIVKKRVGEACRSEAEST